MLFPNLYLGYGLSNIGYAPAPCPPCPPCRPCVSGLPSDPNRQSTTVRVSEDHYMGHPTCGGLGKPKSKIENPWPFVFPTSLCRYVAMSLCRHVAPPTVHAISHCVHAPFTVRSRYFTLFYAFSRYFWWGGRGGGTLPGIPRIPWFAFQQFVIRTSKLFNL